MGTVNSIGTASRSSQILTDTAYGVALGYVVGVVAATMLHRCDMFLASLVVGGAVGFGYGEFTLPKDAFEGPPGQASAMPSLQ